MSGHYYLDNSYHQQPIVAAELMTKALPIKSLHIPPGSPTSFRIKRYTTSVHIMKRSKQHTPMFTSVFTTCIERHNNCDLFSNLQGVHISYIQITQQTRETSHPVPPAQTPTSRPPLPLPQHNIPLPSCSMTPSTRSANNWFPSPPAQHNVLLQVLPGYSRAT